MKLISIKKWFIMCILIVISFIMTIGSYFTKDLLSLVFFSFITLFVLLILIGNVLLIRIQDK